MTEVFRCSSRTLYLKMIDFVSICSNACQSIPNPLHFLDDHPNKSQEKKLLEWGGTGIAYVLKGRGSGLCVWKCVQEGGGGQKRPIFCVRTN